MSHVDEGILHAYLDGELPSAERVALEAHVTQCEACRARLADERALVERASALLGAVRPVERPIPPFEQLRRQPKRSPWRVRASFAWAASVVLALGLGYYLAGTSYRMARPAPEPAAVATNQPVADEAQSRVQRRETAARHLVTPPSDKSAAIGRVDSGALAVAIPPDTVKRAMPLSAPDSVKIVVDGVPIAALQAERVRGETPAMAAPAPNMHDNRSAMREPAANTWPRIDRQTAKTILGSDPVGLPDIAPVTIRRSPDQAGVVVVEQKLDDRTVIQIFQHPTAANGAVDSRGYAYSEGARVDRLARFVGKLRVEIGGPVSVDSLNRLLELVRPLP